MSMVICPKCHQRTSDAKNVCEHCEALLQSDFSKELEEYSRSIYKNGVLTLPKCEKCGAEYDEGETMCSKCGSKI